MKTAISIPDQILQQAEFLANELGMSRSELYLKAIEEFIREREEGMITEKLNGIYSLQNNSLDDVLNEIQLESIKTSNDEW